MSTLAFGFYPSKTYTCKARPAISVQDPPALPLPDCLPEPP